MSRDYLLRFPNFFSPWKPFPFPLPILIFRREMRLLTVAATLSLASSAVAVKCLDCVGRDCMGSFCEGDYCVLSQFAPRWGSLKWGEPQVVKGCMKGSLLRKDIRDHCEAADDNGREVFTCFCKGKDNCNGGRALSRLEVEVVDLLTCECDGKHCGGSKTCLGEMCSYVVNHATGEVEKGCVNASIPLVERRSMGACMIPPITGAMHHSVARDAADLLKTESCVCGSDYCNSQKPEITVAENQKCQTFVNAKVMGTPMKSRNITCSGEFCFKASIKTKLGMMSEYSTIGCASFTGDDALAEELNPIGCATFENEQLEVSACFSTKDKGAIGRARANQQVTEPRKKPKAKAKKPTPPPKMEIEYEEEEEGEEEPEEQPKEAEKPRPKEPEREERGPAKNEKNDSPEEEEEETSTAKNFIFERPTEPPIPDESNTTMITVFILIMLCIVVSGAVWKFELHKKLFRSSYDTVAGG